MVWFKISRKQDESMTLVEMAKEYPPRTWDQVFKSARMELELVESFLPNEFYPPRHLLFAPFDLCPLNKVKVVIIGNEPYTSTTNGYSDANGLAYASRGNVPKMLENIYRELDQEYNQIAHSMTEECIRARNYLNANGGDDSMHNKSQLAELKELSDADILSRVLDRFSFNTPTHGDLSQWAVQGVLLLNASWAVGPNNPGTNNKIWSGVVRRIIEAVTRQNPTCIFLLWGATARAIGDKLGQRTIKLYASHPSPLSANRSTDDIPAFMGCNHFMLANQHLISQGHKPIDWRLN